MILINANAYLNFLFRSWLLPDGYFISIVSRRLPSYSPELHPDELLNADLNEAIGKQEAKRRKGKLKLAVIGHLRRVARLPERVKNILRAAFPLCRVMQRQFNKPMPDK